MKFIAILILFTTFAGCGTQGYVETQVPGPTVTVTPEPVGMSDIETIIADENTYREFEGLSYLTPGLSCTLYTITGGSYIQNDSTHTPTLTGVTQVATFLLTAPFNQPNAPASQPLNVLPAALQANPRYLNLIRLTCQGQLVVTADDYYAFDLSSDDGSVLYLDGSRLIDADGQHGVTEVTGTKLLRRGVHAFRLDFAQTGAGSQALVLNANGVLLDSATFFH